MLRIFNRKYERYTYKNDIALLQIENNSNFNLGQLQLVRLPTKQDVELNPASLNCSIFGYGASIFDGDAKLQLTVGTNINFIPIDLCQQRLGEFMAPENNSGLFCAGKLIESKEIIDSCQGDSGGSLICKPNYNNSNNNDTFIIIGITSYGMGCGTPGIPGVYTSILYHLDWIKNVMHSVK